MVASHLRNFRDEIGQALYGTDAKTPDVTVSNGPSLQAWFDVSGLAAASIGSAAAELAAITGSFEPVTINQACANAWFDFTIKPQGWELPPAWDRIAGLYETQTGWIRLHTNALAHRDAALRVLQTDATRDAVEIAIRKMDAQTLETAIIDEGGCAARLQSFDEWKKHSQGKAVCWEPLIAWQDRQQGKAIRTFGNKSAPLTGLRVLDCTRVLAGPVCTRFLAGFGADVLRIDPPGWNEGIVVPEVTLGKRCATLDLHTEAGRARFRSLYRSADIFVHGLRPGALERLGLGEAERLQINPDTIDVTLNAYGWSGPWARRRGYDSLVQMSAGVAEAGMRASGATNPTPLPVQALDHATGYLMAASALRAIRVRKEMGTVLSAKLSLARTAYLLSQSFSRQRFGDNDTATSEMVAADIEHTDWGPAQRITWPIIAGLPHPHWRYPAGNFHTAQPEWL